MTNATYETMKMFAVACACGYFIGSALGILIAGIIEIVDWVKRKHRKKQTQA